MSCFWMAENQRSPISAASAISDSPFAPRLGAHGRRAYVGGRLRSSPMSVYDLGIQELTERLLGWGEPAYRARQVYAQLWRRAATYEEMTDLSLGLRDRLARELPLEVEVLAERQADRGGTR